MVIKTCVVFGKLLLIEFVFTLKASHACKPSPVVNDILFNAVQETGHGNPANDYFITVSCTDDAMNE